MKKKVLIILIILAALAIASIPAVAGQPNQAQFGFADDPNFVPKEDNLPHPLGVQQAALKQQALDAELNGKAYGKTHEVARGQFVELERTGEDLIFTVLGEFSDFPHNNIAEPDRDFDNTTTNP